MRSSLLPRVAVVALLAVATTSITRAADPPKDVETPTVKPPAKKPAEKPRPLITVSKETTRILGPLREDGYVDCVAALNQLCGQGVTPENNMMVPFWQAMGPKEIGENERDAYFRLLGMAPLSEEGDYAVSYLDFMKKRKSEEESARIGQPVPASDIMQDDAWWEAFDKALERPWKRRELPAIAAWLDANERPMRLLVEASKRPRCFSPFVADGEPPLFASLLPPIQPAREAARMFKTRALLHLGEGRVEAAWDDLLTVHRLGRLIGQRPTMIDGLVAIAIDGMAYDADKILAREAKLTADQARRFQADLDQLAPLPKMVRAVDVGERFFLVDAIGSFARGRAECSRLGFAPEEASQIARLWKSVQSHAIDWDRILVMGHGYYDRIVEADKRPTPRECREAREAIAKEIEALDRAAGGPKHLVLRFLGGQSPRAVMTENMGRTLICLLLPAVDAAFNAEDRAETFSRMTPVALALGGYRGEHGEYPDKLSALVPKYIDELPKDPFSDGDLRYVRRNKGYVLYSIGPNGKDDEGRNADIDEYDRTDPAYQGYEGDDYAIGMPERRRSQ